MNQNHQPDSVHNTSIKKTRTHKVSHTRRLIELGIVTIVVAVLAIIVIPTITTISKAADYSTAYKHCYDIITAFKFAHGDAQYNSVAIPDTTITFTSDHLHDSLDTQSQSIESTYYNFILGHLKTYLSSMKHFNFSFKLMITPKLIVLYYWNQKNLVTLPSEPEYCDPDYVYYVENQSTKLVTYNEFMQLNILSNG